MRVYGPYIIVDAPARLIAAGVASLNFGSIDPQKEDGPLGLITEGAADTSKTQFVVMQPFGFLDEQLIVAGNVQSNGKIHVTVRNVSDVTFNAPAREFAWQLWQIGD